MAKILIVDDDQDVVDVTSVYLREGGHEVEAELDAKKALARIDAVRPALLMLDVMFPDDSTAGFQLARDIRLKHKDLPIIMVTSTGVGLRLGTTRTRITLPMVTPSSVTGAPFLTPAAFSK